MKILKHGSTYQEKKCKNCEAEIGFSYRDIEHKFYTDSYNGAIHETSTDFIYCPDCGCRIVLTLRIDGQERKITN